MIENYVAFDFETANGKNPCSIGIIEFNKGKVIHKYYSLINPNIEKFNPFTTRIHGIRKIDVINEREFCDIWNDIKHFFDNRIIVAHNSSFDVSVLNYSLERYNIQKPINTCYCTLKISRQILNIRNYKLNTLAKYYSIKQDNYHNALEDAYVCGVVFSKLLEEAEDIDSIIKDYVSIIPRKNNPKNKHISTSKSNKKFVNESIDLRCHYIELTNIQTEKLKGQTFVVSGVFDTLSRNELKKLIEDNGGKVSSSISSKTSFIVAGENMGPSKKIKAEQLNIPLISEKEFLDLII
jgi:DNA polymerase III subunit epsilon